ncbi:MAG: ribbon-helix-helix protein, CopG family [Nitrospiraceae bacterium]
MVSGIRIAVHLELEVYRALKVKAARTDRSVSDLVNAAVLESLREDALDLEVFDRRAKEPSRPFEKVLEDLNKPDGK